MPYKDREKARESKRRWTAKLSKDEKRIIYLRRVKHKSCLVCGVDIVGAEKKRYCIICGQNSKSEKLKGNTFYKLVKSRPKGEKHHNWKGGKTFWKKKIWDSKKYKEWRRACMERDSFTCQWCRQIGGALEVHHIRSFSELLDIYNIKNKEEADSEERLWDLHLGITLCVRCHNTTKNGRPKI